MIKAKDAPERKRRCDSARTLEKGSCGVYIEFLRIGMASRKFPAQSVGNMFPAAVLQFNRFHFKLFELAGQLGAESVKLGLLKCQALNPQMPEVGQLFERAQNRACAIKSRPFIDLIAPGVPCAKVLLCCTVPGACSLLIYILVLARLKAVADCPMTTSRANRRYTGWSPKFPLRVAMARRRRSARRRPSDDPQVRGGR
ncbi:hypothetical protein VTK56DRAFT_8900 [Thermocarpiscus australiensis]